MGTPLPPYYRHVKTGHVYKLLCLASLEEAISPDHVRMATLYILESVDGYLNLASSPPGDKKSVIDVAWDYEP